MGHRWKRLLKPVKNFEKFFDFDLTWLPGTPPKGPQGPPITDFSQTKPKVPCGVSPEALLKPVKNF